MQRRGQFVAEIFQTLSAKLVSEFGGVFSQRNLASMIRLGGNQALLSRLEMLFDMPEMTHRIAY